MLPNPQFHVDLVTFTEEILIGKLHFLCSECSPLLQCVPIFYSFCYRAPENIETPAQNVETKFNCCILTHLFPMHHFSTL